jgi:hypothetical protein
MLIDPVYLAMSLAQGEACQFGARNQPPAYSTKAIQNARRKPLRIRNSDHGSACCLPVRSHPLSVQYQSSINRLIYVVRMLALN